MIAAVKGFFRRRAKRAETDAMLARWEADGVFANRCNTSCHLCDEDVLGLERRHEKRSLSGERFVFTEHVAFVCRRCQTVSTASDCSVNPVHVTEWAPRAR